MLFPSFSLLHLDTMPVMGYEAPLGKLPSVAPVSISVPSFSEATFSSPLLQSLPACLLLLTLLWLLPTHLPGRNAVDKYQVILDAAPALLACCLLGGSPPVLQNSVGSKF